MIDDIREGGPAYTAKDEEAAKLISVDAKETERQEIDRLTAEFLARGGKIDEVGIIPRTLQEETLLLREARRKAAAEAMKRTPEQRDMLSKSAARAATTAGLRANNDEKRLEKIAAAAAGVQGPPAPKPEPLAPVAETKPKPAPAPEPMEKKPMNATPQIDKPQRISEPMYIGPVRQMPLMDRIRDVLFREVDQIQNGQSEPDQTSRVLDLIDRIVDSVERERELFPMVVSHQVSLELDEASKDKLNLMIQTAEIGHRDEEVPPPAIDPQVPLDEPEPVAAAPAPQPTPDPVKPAVPAPNPTWKNRDNIKSLMLRYGITAVEIVRAVGNGLDSPKMSNYLSGKNNPSADMAKAIEDFVDGRLAEKRTKMGKA